MKPEDTMDTVNYASAHGSSVACRASEHKVCNWKSGSSLGMDDRDDHTEAPAGSRAPPLPEVTRAAANKVLSTPSRPSGRQIAHNSVKVSLSPKFHFALIGYMCGRGVWNHRCH